MPEKKKTVLTYFENLSLLMVGILFIVFPLFFMSATTDAFVLPKQLLLIALTSIGVLVMGVKTLVEGKLRLRTSPFDLPLVLFVIVLGVSAFFSVNRFDALTAFLPVFFAILLYFVVVNAAKSEKQLLFLLATLTGGATLAALLTILSFFSIYPLPFDYTKATYFTPFGSLLDQAIYFAAVLPIAGYFGYNLINKPTKKAQPSQGTFVTQAAEVHTKKKTPSHFVGFGVAFIFIAVGLGLTVYMLLTTQKPLILPFDSGLQTAMSSISQGTPNVFKSLLLGSGFGTYITDFTQFKPASFNASEQLWAFTFFRSSSFALELLATTGLLGIAAFGFIVFRVVREKNFFIPLVLIIIASLVLPFSFTMIALFFILLALFAIVTIHSAPNKYGESEMYFVALRKGLVTLAAENERVAQNASEKRVNRVLPALFLVAVIAVLSFPLYLVTRYAFSDVVFQRSLVAAANNDGSQTYELQAASINLFPYRDVYYRSFAQTNLALANSLASSQTPDASPSAETQQNILTLIQQSINAGRGAVTVSPMTSFNWNNLSSIYRSLIGFGENADQFTILTLNQAIALDPNNPQQYVDLGGVYYQLGQYDEAIRQFQIAIQLKPDYANAYYNLAHALEEKGDYQQAAQVYQTVKQLVADSEDNVKRVDEDIKNMQARAEAQANQQQQTQQQAPQDQGDGTIDVNQSQTQLPERNPKAEIPGPTINDNLPSNQNDDDEVTNETTPEEPTTSAAPRQ